MGVLSNISNLLSSATPQHIASSAVDYGARALQAVRQTATQVRDHFTHGNGHVLDNVLRNAGNDAVRVGSATGASMGRGIGSGVGALFGGVGSIPGGNLGERAGRALGREVAANIVDGGTGIIQDVASGIPGLSRRQGERHIPNHDSVLERGLAGFAERVMSPFLREQPRLTPQQIEARRSTSIAISARPEDAEAVAAHNARVFANRANQTL